MSESTGLAEMKVAHPFPWKNLIRGMGMVSVIDAENKEVPLLTVLKFLEIVTPQLVSKEKENGSV